MADDKVTSIKDQQSKQKKKKSMQILYMRRARCKLSRLLFFCSLSPVTSPE